MAIRIVNRSLDIPISERTVGYAGDNLVEVRSFELSRYYRDIDLADFSFKLDTEIGGVKNIIDLEKSVTDDTITLRWTIAKSHVLYPGNMAIQIRAFSGNEEIWHSDLNYVQVQPSINASAAIPDPLPSEFVQMEQRVTVAKNAAEEAAQIATEQAGIATQRATEVENIRDSIVTEEEARQIAEADRVSNEQNRIEAENERIIEENIRKSNEVLRQTNENTRNNNENERVLAENERIANEEARQTNEQNRETAETARDTAEAIRANNEAARIAAEQARIEAENTREANEATRQSNEAARQEAEAARVSAEADRVQAEQGRAIAENVRDENETIRQTNEAARVAAEQARVEAENLREQTIARLDGRFKEQELKVLKIEKDVDEYRKVMSQVNVNQEAKQTVSGYGVVSLPKNAANGKFSVESIKGNTYTNLLGIKGRGDSLDGWARTDRVTVNNGFFEFDPTAGAVRGHIPFNVISGHKYYISAIGNSFNGTTGYLLGVVLSMGAGQSATTQVSSDRLYLLTPTDVNFKKVSGFLTATENGDCLNFGRFSLSGDNLAKYRLQKIMVIDLTAMGLDSLTLEECDKRFSNYIDNTKSTISSMRLRSVSEDESEESTAYIIAKDENGDVVMLNSLPNGTCDEVSNGKHIQRIGTKTNVVSGTVINYADMAEGGTYYAWNEDGETETGIKGDTLGIDATTLIYQLAEPIEIPVQVSGSIVSYPNGTIYIERILPDAGVYTDKISVLHQDAPIKRLDRLSKVDFYTGVETALDVSEAVIAEDKLSFTHPDLSEGDIVFFEYEYDVESTEGETEVEFYDSRYVVKDTETSKFYKWNIVVANGQPSIELVEV